MGESKNRQAVISQKKKKSSGRGLMIAFPIVLVLLIGLLVVLNQQSKQAGQLAAESALTSLSLEGQPVLGSEDAKISVVEFGDYKCPACKDWEENIFAQLKADYVDTGKVKFTFMHYPFIGDDSFTAAYASEVISTNYPDAFWKFHEEVYAQQQDERLIWATPEKLAEIAAATVPSLDTEAFKKQLTDKQYNQQVNQDKNIGDNAGVQGTPSVYVNGKQYTGHYLDYDGLKSLIDQELAALEGSQ